MINYDAINQAPLTKEPFTFFGADQIFDKTNAKALARGFPEIKSGGSFPLESSELGDSLKQLIEEINSDAFRSSMADKFSVDLKDKPIIITARGFSRKKDGQVHTDSKTKLITVLIYFNEGWDQPTGNLRMLASNDLQDTVKEFNSNSGQMIAFKVTENCWHGYESFEGKRQSLQINYLVEEKFTQQHLIRHKLSAFFKKLFK